MPDNNVVFFFFFSDSMVFMEENLAQIILNSSQKGMMGSCLWSVAVFNYGIDADRALTA